MDLGTALALADELLEHHGLGGWTVRFDRAKTRAGSCRFRDREITLSAHLTQLHSVDDVRDTILHEIAHALVGPGHGHDRLWRATAQAIGSSGQRCSSADAPQVPGEWVGTCSSGHVVHRHRRPTRLLFCARCGGGARLESLLAWTHRGQPVPMSPAYIAELEGLGSGRPGVTPGRFTVGTRVRVTAPGRYQGLVAPIVKRGRTRYHLAVRGGRLTVPFSLVEPEAAPARR